MDYDPICFNMEIPMTELNKYRTLISDHWILTHPFQKGLIHTGILQTTTSKAFDSTFFMWNKSMHKYMA